MAIVIGLTAKIGAGKTTVTNLFKKHGATIIDCDQIVRDLYLTERGITLIRQNFPDAIIEGQIAREVLRRHIRTDVGLKKLEQITHPIVQEKVNEYIRAAAKDEIIVIEIQKLFENKAHQNPAYMMDHTLLVKTPKDQRKSRVLATRLSVTEEDFDLLDSRQMDDEQKEVLSDFVIDNSDGANAEEQVIALLGKIKAKSRPSS
jgi:dephospho-CoA kinase